MPTPESMDHITEVREKMKETERKIAEFKQKNPGKEIPAFFSRELQYYENQIENLKKY